MKNCESWIISLFFAVLSLTGMSLVTLAGAANDFGVKYFYIQFAASFLGFVTMAVMSTIDYEEIADKLSVVLFVLSVFFLGAHAFDRDRRGQ